MGHQCTRPGRPHDRSGGLYRVGDMANAMRLAGFNCPLGYSCPSGNITLKILCPAGH